MPRRVIPAPPPRWLGVIAVLCLLTACGGSSKHAATTPPATTPPASSPVSSSVTPSTDVADTSTVRTPVGASEGSCSTSPAVVAAGRPFTVITKLSLAGGCGVVTAATTLAPGALGSPSVTQAIAICTAITKVAYVGAVYGVSIEGSDGHELAASTKDQRQCI